MPSACYTSVLKRLDKLPTLSPMVMRLAHQLANRDTDGRSLSQTIEKDAVLCGQILKVANSAMYSRRGQIASVRQAVAFLGVNKLRRLALGFSLLNFFGRVRAAHSWSTTRYNLHSLAVATIADMIAPMVPVGNSESAFIGGLLHDIGKLAIAVAAPEEYDVITALCSSQGVPALECERQVLGMDHAELSGMVVAKWDLPRELQQAVAYHHDPAKRPRATGHENELHLCEVLGAADRFVRALGMVVEPTPPVNCGPPEITLPGYQLPSAQIAKEFETEWLRTCAAL